MTIRGYDLDGRQVSEVIGLARGIIADDKVNDKEAEYLYKWLAAQKNVSNNPLVNRLFERVDEIFSDAVVDDDERADLFDILNRLTASDFEVGELLKSTTLPLCEPAPDIEFDGNRFCFTGTFVFGQRKDCVKAVAERGGVEGSLVQSTDFLVIGEYATDSWKHSSFGRKIEKAVGWRENGIPISIVSEAHWRSFL